MTMRDTTPTVVKFDDEEDGTLAVVYRCRTCGAGRRPGGSGRAYYADGIGQRKGAAQMRRKANTLTSDTGTA